VKKDAKLVKVNIIDQHTYTFHGLCLDVVIHFFSDRTAVYKDGI